MNRHIIKTFVFLILIGCSSIEYKPKYKDFENAWERENLIGKVKALEQYKANVTDFETKKTEIPIIEFKKKFSETGKITYQEYFDSFGELTEYTKNSYYHNGYRTESVSENFVMPSKSFATATFDSVIGKQISAHVYYNDSLDVEAFFEYDKNGNLIVQSSIQNGDTTSNRFEYIYDNNGKMLLKKQIQNSEYGKHEYLNEFKYDQIGNLIELTNKSESFGETKLIYEFDSKNRIRKIEDYISNQIEKETSFDKYYNKILVKFYMSGTLTKQIKYKYDFDKSGNWIQRKAFVKEYFGEDKSWIPVFVETRKISYFE